LIFESIKKVNPELAKCISLLPIDDYVLKNLFIISDQIMISESLKEYFKSLELYSKTYFIHYGRTCTGLTSVILRKNAKEVAVQLSKEVYKNLGASFEENSKKFGAFSAERAKELNKLIEFYINKGDAEDITLSITNKKRIEIKGEEGIITPTVLLIKNNKSEIFGVELPFSFVTIIQVDSKKGNILII